MREFVLSKRMETVVNMVSPQSFTIADIGCDHAYVSIALIKRNIAKKVIAMDVKNGPLEIAKRNVVEYQVADRIDIRLSDGLDALNEEEADSIIIAGMGGLLIQSILEKGEKIINHEKKRPELILQPQSEIKKIRLFLKKNGYRIVKEEMLKDEGKIYTVIKAIPQVDDFEYSEAQMQYGKYNLDERNQVLYTYLKREKVVLQRILEELERNIEYSIEIKEIVPKKTRERIATIKEEIKINNAALAYYD